MNTQLIKREIKKPNGEVYAEVWREGGQLRLVLSQYSPGIQIRMDEKAIPQLIEALKSIADPERQEPFGFVALNEVTEQFNSVNCGTIYRLPAEGRLPLYTHSQLKQEQGKPVAKQRPFTKQQRDSICMIYDIATGSTTINSLQHIAKIANQLLTEDVYAQPKQEQGERVAKDDADIYAFWARDKESEKRKPLTDETRNWIVATCPTPRHIIDAVERMHDIKE